MQILRCTYQSVEGRGVTKTVIIDSAEILRRICRNQKITFAAVHLGEQSLCAQYTDETTHLPPVTMAHFEERATESTYVKQFEDLSLKIRELSNVKSNPSPEDEDVGNVSATDINNAIRALIVNRKQQNFEPDKTLEEIEKNRDKNSSPKDATKGLEDVPSQYHLEPLSLKIIGATIDGDIDLSNICLPISIRLIGCHIRGAVLLDRAQLNTVDLSGSVIERGISGSSLNLNGAFRIRRSVLYGPIDIPASQVVGIFDASDCIIFPKNTPSNQTAFVAQRGILNLETANLMNGVHIQRARIYGGMNLRSINCKRLFFANDMVLLSPLAHLEIMMLQMQADLTGKKVEITDASPAERLPSLATYFAAEDLSKLLHSKSCLGLKDLEPKDIETRQKEEELGGISAFNEIISNKNSLQYRMMEEHSRAADTALRFEASNIQGPVHAKGARISGLVDMKGIKVEGGIYFEGARFRSAIEIKTVITKLVQENETFAPAKSEYSLILKKVSNAIEASNWNLNSPPNPEHKEYIVDLWGSKINGTLSFAKDIWRTVLPKKVDPFLLAQINKEPRISLKADELPRRTMISGNIRFSKANIKGDVKFISTIMNAFGGTDHSIISENYTLKCKKCIIGGDLNLKKSIGINSINARNAEIRCDVLFCSPPGYDQLNGQYNKVEKRAVFTVQRWDEFAQDIECLWDSPKQKWGSTETISSKAKRKSFRFSGSKIGGSAFLLFDKNCSPDLSFAYGSIGGKLMILPTDGIIITATDKEDIEEYFPTRHGKPLVLSRELSSKKFEFAHNWARIEKPTIDLHGLHVPVFVHNHRAWPYQDCLVISGLNYSATEASGHLFPHVRLWKDVKTELDLNQATKWRVLITLSALLALCSILGLILCANGLFSRGFDTPAPDIFSLFGGYLFIGLLFYGTVRSVLTRTIHPRNNAPKSLAIQWLKLQRRHFSTRSRLKDVRPSEQYLRAAIVLRTAGRNSSANEVEVARIHQRVQNLSLRKSGLRKLMLFLFKFFMDYGFNPAKAVFFTTVIFSCFWVGFQICGNEFNHAAGTIPNGRVFHPLFFTLDTFVPFLDLKLYGVWQADNPIIQKWVFACRILGWIFLSAIIAAVITRLETLWAKSKLL